MKKLLTLLLLLLLPAFSFAQEEEEIDDISNYPSKEKDSYYQEWKKTISLGNLWMKTKSWHTKMPILRWRRLRILRHFKKERITKDITMRA